MKEKVSVIGIGRLGLSFALLLDSKGYDVCGCDANNEYVELLKSGTFNSDEPRINEMYDRCNITFTTNSAEAFNHSSYIFIFVPTPSKENGEYNHDCIEKVIEDFEKHHDGNPSFTAITICCTVMPGYCETLKERLSKVRTNLLYNPSFISQGSIVDNLKNADIVLIGGKIPTFVHEMYTKIMDKVPNFKYLSLTGAEIAKISINCFLTMKIAFANMIGEIIINSEESGVNDILETIGSDSRIGKKFLNYGFSSGGVCLPRDQKALGVYAKQIGINTTFTENIDEENKRHAEYLKEYWIKQNPDKNIPFQFSYLGYKKGVNILTESYQFKLCMDLLSEGYKIELPHSVILNDTPQIFKDYFDKGMILFQETKGAICIN